jgi:hypothetical protein
MRGMPLALAFVLGGCPGLLSAGPITFNTALPVHAGEWIVRQQTIWLRARDDPSPLGRELNVFVAPAVVVYGPNSRLALFAIEPFLSKQIELSTPAGRVTRATTGFGDLTAMARVTWPSIAAARRSAWRRSRVCSSRPAGTMRPMGSADSRSLYSSAPGPGIPSWARSSPGIRSAGSSTPR